MTLWRERSSHGWLKRSPSFLLTNRDCSPSLRGDGREAGQRDGGRGEDGAYMHTDDDQQASYDVIYALFDKQNRA